MEKTSLMRNHGGGIWRRHLDEASWMRNQGGDIMEEASWELSGGLVGQAEGSVRSWLARGGLEPESVKKHCVLQSLSSRRAIPFESGEGPCHDVPQNTRKMKRAPINGIQIPPPGPYTRPWEPLQPRAVWGTTHKETP